MTEHCVEISEPDISNCDVILNQMFPGLSLENVVILLLILFLLFIENLLMQCDLCLMFFSSCQLEAVIS